MSKYPSLIATSEIFSILLPLKAIFLPYLIDEFIICCNLWILDANVATIILPLPLLNKLSKVSPTVFSDMVYPGWHALVLSAISNNTPCLPILANLCKSITLPSTGVKSTLISPVWTTIPNGVWIANAQLSAILWFVLINSTFNLSKAIVSPGLTTFNSTISSILCSSSLLWINPIVKLVA